MTHINVEYARADINNNKDRKKPKSKPCGFRVSLGKDPRGSSAVRHDGGASGASEVYMRVNFAMKHAVGNSKRLEKSSYETKTTFGKFV